MLRQRSTGIEQDGVLMNTTKIVGKTTFILACMLGIAYVLGACSSDSDDSAQIIADEFVSVNGTFKDFNGTAAIEDVVVEGVYSSPGDPLNPVTATDVNGDFSLQVLKNKPAYLHMTRTDLATVNTLKFELNANLAGMEITMPTLDESQTVIDTALGSAPELGSKAWLTIDVFDGSGAEQGGVTISPTPIPNLVVYTDCNGTDSGLDVTKTCNPARDVPMYIAYYDVPGNVSVSVNNKETQFAPLRMGEITYLEF